MRHDLAVIGGGSAGLAAATFAAGVGARVALVEADRLGGECTWTGCVPSKALINAARMVHEAGTSQWLDVSTVDFPGVMRDVRRAVDRVAETDHEAALRARGIDVVMGRASFLSASTIQVDARRLEAQRFVICTGAEPAMPPIHGLDQVPTLTYETVFDMDELPRRLLVLGAGPQGVELAQAFQRLGSSVALVEQAGRILPELDPEASLLVDECLRHEGVELRLAFDVERIEYGGDELAAVGAGGLPRLAGGALLVATGRKPRVAGLGLEKIGVAVTAAGIDVGHDLRTSRPHIYAAGDVTGGPQFTHYAVWQGYAAARNALFPGRTRGVRTPVPRAVFTDPEVAQVGLSEADAMAGGREIEVHRWPMEHVDRAQAEADTKGFIKLVTERGGRLLGATIVSSGAAELANQIAIAMDAGVGLSRLARTILIYPTRSFGLFQVASTVRLARAASSRSVRLLSQLTWRRQAAKPVRQG